MTGRTFLIGIASVLLGAFLLQEFIWAPVPFCDRFAQVAISPGQIAATECTRNMVIGTSYICAEASTIVGNPNNYPSETVFACRSPYRSGVDVE